MMTDMGWLCWSVFQMHPRDSISEHDDFSVRTMLYRNGICFFCYVTRFRCVILLKIKYSIESYLTFV